MSAIQTKPCEQCVCGMTDAEQYQCFLNAALQPYGAMVNTDGLIQKGERVTGVRPVLAKGRLRFESSSGLLASGKPSAAFVAEFVERFWYWRAV